MKIDLHAHTNASDGTLSPTEFVKEAKLKGVSTIAVTDHDTIDGVEEALEAGKSLGVEVVPGVEITVDDDKHKVYDIHVLGLFIEPDNKELIKLLEESRKAREEQKVRMVNKLRSMGYKITIDEVKAAANGPIGRPHIAEVMARNNPEFKSHDEVFEKLIGNGRPAYLERKSKISLKDAVGAIKKAGGIASLAHLFLYSSVNFGKSGVENLLKSFKEEGGDAIEVFYPYDAAPEYRNAKKEKAWELAKKAISYANKFGLKITGGSDFHGNNKEIFIGKMTLPHQYFSELIKGNAG